MRKCSRCNGSLYSNNLSLVVHCLNCGYEPAYISKDVEDEIALSKGSKTMPSLIRSKYA